MNVQKNKTIHIKRKSQRNKFFVLCVVFSTALIIFGWISIVGVQIKNSFISTKSSAVSATKEFKNKLINDTKDSRKQFSVIKENNNDLVESLIEEQKKQTLLEKISEVAKKEIISKNLEN